MNISIIGTGYVGLVTGVGFAIQKENRVICVDSIEQKIEMLRNNKSPIYEIRIEEYVRELQEEGQLSFTTNFKMACQESDVIFIAVGTPQTKSSKCDLSYVNSVVSQFLEWIGDIDIPTTRILVVKSTVPPGTCKKIQKHIDVKLSNTQHKVYVVSNPEFLKEGVALEDFLFPDRIVIGSPHLIANVNVAECYGYIARTTNVIHCKDTTTSELIKYASNAMLACRISFINEMSNIALQVGADIQKLQEGIGADTRIGNAFLKAGCGYGGSCFPKDIAALKYFCDEYEIPSIMISAIEQTNDIAKDKLINSLAGYFGDDLKYKKIAIWGVSFKPDTDDIREAPALKMIKDLYSLGVSDIHVYDPKGLENLKEWVRSELPTATQNIYVYDNKYDAIKNTDALVICTEWEEFKNANWEKIKNEMLESVIVDGRNILLNTESSKIFDKYFHM